MSTFVDPFLLVLTLVMTILLLVGNVYFVAHYSHRADTSFGTSTACKAVIVKYFFIRIIGCFIYYRLKSNALTSFRCGQC